MLSKHGGNTIRPASMQRILDVENKSRLLISIHTATGVLSSPPGSQESAPGDIRPSALFRPIAFGTSNGVRHDLGILGKAG